MKNKSNKESRFSRCMKAPFRALIKARDMYVKGMTGCAEGMNMNMGSVARNNSPLPKSFSTTSNRSGGDEDLVELIRAVSQRRKAQNTPSPVPAPAVVRSQSVAIGRIDEDQPCNFEEEDLPKGTGAAYPRSRSYAVSKRSGERWY